MFENTSGQLYLYVKILKFLFEATEIPSYFPTFSMETGKMNWNCLKRVSESVKLNFSYCTDLYE